MKPLNLAVSVMLTVVLASCVPAGSASGRPLPEDTGVLADFEEAESAWAPGAWPDFADSSATRVSIVTTHATRGQHALQLDFDKRDQPKAIFILRRNLNLSRTTQLAFDLYNDTGSAESVGIAIRAGNQWQESRASALKPDANAVSFDLTQPTFKTAATNWQYSSVLSGLDAVTELAIVIYPNRSGSVYMDNLLAEGSVLATSVDSSGQTANATHHVGLHAASDKVHQYSLQEFKIDTDWTVDNPFDPSQLSIDVRLKLPTGEWFTVPAFVYQDYGPDGRTPVGPQTWKARFTATREGVWTAEAVISDGRTSAATSALTFTVLPAVGRGFVRVNPANPQYLAFENGEAFFPIGINLGWGHEEPLKDFARWFDALQRNGSNVARIWMASWSFGIEWKDTGLGRYRLYRAWLLDKVMQMAEERGIYVILVLINHGAFNTRVNPEWVDNPYNVEQGGPCITPEDFAQLPVARQLFKQRLRYIAARWAYSPNLLAWEWWNEVNFTPIADPNLLRPWLQEMTSYLHGVDPYHHLTTISYSDANDPRIVNLPEVDLMQRHMYSALDPRSTMAKAYAELNSYGTMTPTKPTLFTEFGSSASGEIPTRFDPEGIQFHNGLWASAFNGFASAAMYWWWDSYIDVNNYWYHLNGLAQFLADEDVSTLKPLQAQVMTSTVQASALANHDRALLWLRSASYSVEEAESQFRLATILGNLKEADWRLELPPRANISIQLEGMQAGAWRVSWYDTRTAEMVASSEATVRDGALEIRAPVFDRDLAARLRRITP
ncbi:MAG TPA: cellulase family glycosylhydrolase [Anaerolineae bacterium]|jgi:hypothetical protein